MSLSAFCILYGSASRDVILFLTDLWGEPESRDSSARSTPCSHRRSFHPHQPSDVVQEWHHLPQGRDPWLPRQRYDSSVLSEMLLLTNDSKNLTTLEDEMVFQSVLKVIAVSPRRPVWHLLLRGGLIRNKGFSGLQTPQLQGDEKG